MTKPLSAFLTFCTITSTLMTARALAVSGERSFRTAAKAVAARTALDESGEKGEFKRVDAAWRNWISNGT